MSHPLLLRLGLKLKALDESSGLLLLLKVLGDEGARQSLLDKEERIGRLARNAAMQRGDGPRGGHPHGRTGSDFGMSRDRIVVAAFGGLGRFVHLGRGRGSDSR